MFIKVSFPPCSMFVPSNRVWQIVLEGVCCLSFHSTNCAAIGICAIYGQEVVRWWGGGEVCKQHSWYYMVIWSDKHKKKRTHASTRKMRRVLLTRRHIVLLLLVTRCLLPTATALKSMWHDGSWMTKTAGNRASEEKMQQAVISPCRREPKSNHILRREGNIYFHSATAPLLQPVCGGLAHVSI